MAKVRVWKRKRPGFKYCGMRRGSGKRGKTSKTARRRK